MVPRPSVALTTPQIYHYGFQTLLTTVVGWFFFAFAILLFFSLPIVFAVVWFLTGTIFPPGSDLPGFAFVWIFSAPGALFALGAAHLFSPILVSDEHLAVTFFFGPLRIPWKDVLELRPMVFPNHGVLVRVSKSSLPWFYAIYGETFWRLGGRYIPISSSIENYQELIKEIKSRSKITAS